jgi:hypothetical protein
VKRILSIPILFAAALGAQKFYPDDPIERMPKPMRVEKANSRKLSDYYDFFLHTLTKPGERHNPGHQVPAGAVNTLGEVPDSAWYQNRHGRRRMTMEELVRGPDTDNPPSMDGKWTVTKAKTEGVTPGFEIDDSRGVHYWLKFDPQTNPEMASAADVIGSKLFYALGYNVPENYIVYFTRDQLVLTTKSQIKDRLGKKRAMTSRDITEVLLKVPQDEQGRYRAVASLGIGGAPLGPFRYHGTRSDDPNDIVPHEHRRDLRGLFVFCAWLGHDDSRSINTADFLVEENGLKYFKHYLIDFGSILGSASEKANSARSGNAHLFAWRPAAIQFFTLGLYVPRWARADFPDLPSVGRFEYEVFDPEKYKTEYPNPAFENRLPDDTFWAAKQVMAFSDEGIRAIVKTGRYSNPEAERWVVKCLIERRNKIGRTYFAKVLPLDQFEIREERLEFENLAFKYGFSPSQEYAAQWSRFDNEKGLKTALVGANSFSLPPELRDAAAGHYFAADIQGSDPKKTVTVYIRKEAAGVRVVGIDRTW